MKKAMLSQPMAGKTEEEIIETRNRAISALKAQGYEIVNTLFTDEWYSNEKMEKRGVVQIPLCFLAKSQEMRAVGKAAIVPVCFAVNEPLLFAAPIVLNPVFFVPFVFARSPTSGSSRSLSTSWA